MRKKLKRSTADRALSGVCGGIANWFGIPSLTIRLIFLITTPVSLWIYVILVWSLEDDVPF